MSAAPARNTRPMACPSCRKYHIDEGEYAERAHYTHRCVNDAAGAGCGAEWTIEGHAVFGVLPKQIAPWIRADARLVWRFPNEYQERSPLDVLFVREISEHSDIPYVNLEIVRKGGTLAARSKAADQLAVLCRPASPLSIDPFDDGQLRLLAVLAADPEGPAEGVTVRISSRQAAVIKTLYPGLELPEAIERTLNQLAKALAEVQKDRIEVESDSRPKNGLEDLAVAWRELGERIFAMAADIERAAAMGDAEPALTVAEDAREVGRDLLGVVHAIDVDDLKTAKAIVAPRRRHVTADFDVVVRDYANHAAGAPTAAIVEMLREGERGLDALKEMIA